MNEPSKEKGYDRIVVAGAGAAGISASIAGAKSGLGVDLIEARSSIGGTAVRGLLHTLAGFLDGGGNVIESEICQELCFRLASYTEKRKIGRFWVLQVEPKAYREVAMKWLMESKSIRLHFKSEIESLKIESSLIKSAWVRADPDWQTPHRAPAFVDATGSASLAKIAGQA